MFTPSHEPEARAAAVTLHARMLRQAARTPEAIALLAPDGSAIAYGALARRVARLARHLRSLGVGPDAPVGVCLPRDLDLPTALLSVMAAGGAYLPLDPAYPAQRTAFALADAQARWVITRSDVALPSPADGDAPSFTRIDLDRLALDDLPTDDAWIHDLDRTIGPDRLAYLIYTSGSTGRPKGVAISHRCAIHLLDWAQTVFDDDDLRGTLAATSVCFDLSIFELFLPLSRGAVAVLARDALQLADLPTRDRVTLINTVPSAIGELVALDALPAGVRVVNLAGEPLKRALVDRIHAQRPTARVYNLYGPSEDTTYSTGTQVPAGVSDEPSIGLPLPGTRADVLDARGAPTIDGEAGELWLGGAGVSRGYLGRPSATAARYRPDPLATTPGARRYRTGDRVRRDAAGVLHFLGRLDHQVKIRGFRVELGEIEAVLARRSDVQQTVIVARGEGAAKQLVAYVEPKRDAAPLDVADLRRHVAAQLPAPMVPSLFVPLASLPLLPNGKIDRRRLPDPATVPATASGREISTIDARASAPRTPTEQMVAACMAEVLQLPSIGRDDDFFALGGHSLLAARLRATVLGAIGLDIGATQLHDTPTIARLAAAIEARAKLPQTAPSATDDDPDGGVPIAPIARAGELPVTISQAALWLLAQLGDPAIYNVPIAMHLTGDLNVAALRAALTQLIARHEPLRSRFVSNAQGDPRTVIDPPPDAFDLPLEDLSHRFEPLDEALAQVDVAARRRPDLAEGPLLWGCLYRLGARVHVLSLIVHHIVIDGLTLEMLFRELGVLYAAAARGETAQLPAPTIQQVDIAAHREALAVDGRWDALADPWRAQLAGVPMSPLDLPTDRPAIDRPARLGALHQTDLDADLVAQLDGAARARGCTPYALALGAFLAWLRDATGQDDLVVGVPLTGRGPQSETTIGYYVNTAALRLDVGRIASGDALIHRVRDALRSIHAHQAMPFARVVKALGLFQEQRNHVPLLDASFQLRNAYFGPDVLPGLQANLLPAHNGTAKFTLEVSLVRAASGALALLIEYDADMFRRRTIEGIAADYVRVLGALLARPEAPLDVLVAALPVMEAV
ncbi:MAG: amino acid adenylation domain-containing protein [Acidobacteriota bacterium]